MNVLTEDVNDKDELSVDDVLVEMDGSPSLLCNNAEYAITGEKVFDLRRVEAFTRDRRPNEWHEGLGARENIALIWGDDISRCIFRNV